MREAAVKLFATLKEKAEPLLPQTAALLRSPEVRTKAAAASALGAVGPKAGPYADDIANFLSDSTEDRSQLVYTVAGIEYKSPSTLRIPACAACNALAQIDGLSYARQIADLATHQSPEVKLAVADALGESGAKYEDVLARMLTDASPVIRAGAACGLGKIAKANGAEEQYAEKVALGLEDASPLVKAACATAIGQMGEEGAAFSDSLHALFENQSKVVRSAAVGAMGGIGIKGQLYTAYIARLMGDPAPVVRCAAVGALPALGQRGESFAQEVAFLLNDQDENVQKAAGLALGKMGQVGQLYLDQAGLAYPAITQ